MRLEIDAQNCIRIFRTGEDFPFFEQPTWPNGTAWRSRAEAETWANEYLLTIQNGDPLPPLYPEN